VLWPNILKTLDVAAASSASISVSESIISYHRGLGRRIT
jgi:hypothetical protein